MSISIQKVLILCGGSLILISGQRANAQRPGTGFSQQQFAAVSQWSGQLLSELTQLQRDLAMDVRGPNTRHVSRGADAALATALHFDRALKAGVGRAYLSQDFQNLDRQLRQLFRNLESRRQGQGQAWGVIVRDAARVQYADDQLHVAISGGAGTIAGNGITIVREARALERESRYLAYLANRLLSNRAIDQRLQNAILNFAGTAKRFRQAVERSNNAAQLSQSFSGLQQAWRKVVAPFNISRQGGFLFRQAQRVNQTYNDLALHILQGG